MAQRFLFGLGGSGGGASFQGSQGAMVEGEFIIRDPENFIVVTLTGVGSINSTSSAKALAIQTVDPAEQELGSWYGIKWTLNTQRSYGIGTGNGGATIRDLYDRERVEWYTVTTDALADFLTFMYTDNE